MRKHKAPLEEQEELKSKKPKILLFDIETAPNLAWVWGVWEQNAIDLKGDWYILSFAAKWLDDSKVIVRGLCDYHGYKKHLEDDKQLVKELWDLFNEADIVIGHNGDEFDIKKCNTRFLIHGFGPPAPVRSIDTKKVAKKYFRFDSNKLDELGRQLGLGRKMHHEGFELWKGCMAGDKRSWSKMLAYNKQDVILLESVYLKLRSWMQNHPNLNMFNDTMDGCPNCGSHHVHRRGVRRNKTTAQQRFQCQDCGAWSSGPTIKLTEDQKPVYK